MIWLLLLALVAAALLLLGAPYVPTHQTELQALFDELGEGERRVFADLGSGDGRVLKQAQARGFEVIGFEVNPLFWLISKFRVGGGGAIRLQPWQWADLSEVDVIYIFSTSWHMRSQHIEQLPEPATVVIYGAQPKAFAKRTSTTNGSAVIYQPVARE